MLFGLAVFLALCQILQAIVRLPIQDDTEDCFLPVLLQYNPRNVHLICADPSYCPSNIINTNPGIVWTLYDRGETITVAHEWEDFCVLAASDFEKMASLLKGPVKCHMTRIILTLPADISFRDMKALFDVAWSAGIVDIVVSKRRDDVCECYTYIPFSRGKCYDTSPVLLDQRHKGAKHVDKTFFPLEKISGLHLCELEVRYDILARLPSSKPEATRWYRFASFLLKAMNAKHEPPLNYTTYNLFQDNMTGVAISQYAYIPWRLPYYVFSPIIRQVVSGVCVQKIPVSSVQWFRIFREFTYQVWCCIFLTFCATVCFVHFVVSEKRSISSTILVCLLSLLNMDAPVKVALARDRLFVSFWLLACLVLNAAYQSHLVSELTVRFNTDAIENVQDFLKSDITMLVPEDHLRALKALVWITPELEPLATKVITTKKDLWEILRPADKVAYACQTDELGWFLPSYRQVPGSTFQFGLSYFIMQKPTPLERLFVKSGLRIFDAGAFDYIDQGIMRTSSDREREEGAVAIDFRGLSGAFMLWLCGCCVSFLVFIAEFVKGSSKGRNLVK